MVSVFDYTDYRSFLKELFSETKQKNVNFSYRYFNCRAGIKSSGFLKLVMDGKRNLATDGIRKVSKGFELNKSEARYFEALVRFNQAETQEAKDQYFQELSQQTRFLKAKPLTMAQYNLFSQWHYVAILELVRLDTKGIKDVQWIHEHIHPMISQRDINRAVEDMVKLGMLAQDARGHLSRADAMLTTPDEVHSVAVANYHVRISQLASRVVKRERSQDREFSALTVATSEKGLRIVKKEIQQFRKRLHSILEQIEGEPRDVVAQVNMQLFKLSRKGKS